MLLARFLKTSVMFLFKEDGDVIKKLGGWALCGLEFYIELIFFPFVILFRLFLEEVIETERFLFVKQPPLVPTFFHLGVIACAICDLSVSRACLIF